MNDIRIVTGSGDGKFPSGLRLYYSGEENGYPKYEAMHLIGDPTYPKIFHDYEKWVMAYGETIYFQSFQSPTDPTQVTVWDYINGTPPTPTLETIQEIFVANGGKMNRYSKHYRRKHGIK